MMLETGRAFPGHPEGVPLDFETDLIDFARRVLDDVPCCRGADYDVKWIWDRTGSYRLPMLVMAFVDLRSGEATPALSVAMVNVRPGTLLENYPAKELFNRDRFRKHLLQSVDQYLNKVGIPMGLRVTG